MNTNELQILIDVSASTLSQSLCESFNLDQAITLNWAKTYIATHRVFKLLDTTTPDKGKVGSRIGHKG